jgi:hypothetical protein
MSKHQCDGHGSEHVHGPDCGHERVEHDGHFDYRVGDHLHHVLDGECVVHAIEPAAG